MNFKQLNKIKYKNLKINQEIRFVVCSNLLDLGFSSQILYFSFKRRFHTFHTRATNTKSINLNLKQSRSVFKTNNNLGNLNGFYRAL
jgi:hypothetical protein